MANTSRSAAVCGGGGGGSCACVWTPPLVWYHGEERKEGVCVCVSRWDCAEQNQGKEGSGSQRSRYVCICLWTIGIPLQHLPGPGLSAPFPISCPTHTHIWLCYEGDRALTGHLVWFNWFHIAFNHPEQNVKFTDGSLPTHWCPPSPFPSQSWHWLVQPSTVPRVNVPN